MKKSPIPAKFSKIDASNIEFSALSALKMDFFIFSVTFIPESPNCCASLPISQKVRRQTHEPTH